ncbi:MAG: HAD-IA family hydrolase [Bacteroidetes bacterium]|nr:HAD-IA family hydrolase [Bacteroidota bacterium]
MLSITCDAILFDLDGVLLDSNHIYEAHWELWANQRGISYSHILEVHHGRPVTETIQIVAPHLNPVEEAETYRDELLSSNHLKQVCPFDGVSSILYKLPIDRWAIATSAPRSSAIEMLKHSKLPMPKVFVSGDDIAIGKPAPYPYLRAAWGLNHQIDRCVVIEDAPAGIQSGRSAGAHVIAVQTTNSAHSLNEADTLINQITDLHIEDHESHLRLLVHI